MLDTGIPQLTENVDYEWENIKSWEKDAARDFKPKAQMIRNKDAESYDSGIIRVLLAPHGQYNEYNTIQYQKNVSNVLKLEIAKYEHISKKRKSVGIDEITAEIIKMKSNRESGDNLNLFRYIRKDRRMTAIIIGRLLWYRMPIKYCFRSSTRNANHFSYIKYLTNEKVLFRVKGPKKFLIYNK